MECNNATHGEFALQDEGELLGGVSALVLVSLAVS
jgi:hypothetical protein